MLHKQPRSLASLSDEYETPVPFYQEQCEKFHITPELDVAADYSNSKSPYWYYKEDSALNKTWDMDVWCNPPHTLTKEFARYADQQWSDNDINILMIVPANSICAKYFDDIFEKNHATYHRINGRPTFLENGRPCEKPARNSYFAVVWREGQRC